MVSFVLILESFNAIWGYLSKFENSVRYGVVNRDKLVKWPQIAFKLSKMRKNDTIECSRVFIR